MEFYNKNGDDGFVGITVSTEIPEIFVGSNATDTHDEQGFTDDEALLSDSEDALIVEPNKALSTESSMADMKSSELRKLKDKPQLIPIETIPEQEIKKLDFESIGLLNREKEITGLRSCLNRMLARTPPDGPNEENKEAGLQSGKKELVFLSGLSGSGKSTVINSLEPDVRSHDSGMFVVGKFDQTTSDKPYSGVSKAFGKICEKIVEMPNDVVLKIKAEILESFGNDVEVLVDLIPELRYIIKQYPTSIISDAEDAGGINGFESLRFAFRTLARSFCAIFSPLVVVLEDLQWSDISSLQVLEYLITDAQNPDPIMIIGSYRSDVVDENSVLTNKILALHSKRRKFSFNMTQIKVEAFTVEDVTALIKSRIAADNDEKIIGLATLCVKRTMGNPYFVLEFLKMLKNEGLLTYDVEGSKWKWDLAQIEEVTMSTANVVVLLQSKIQKLPKQVQRLLQYAACIGSSFSVPTLELIWKKSNFISFDKETADEPLERLIALAEENFFLEKSGPNHYRWVHDKVQEAALLLTKRTMTAFQLDVGSSLYYCLDEKSLEEDLFNVADIINSGNVTKRPEFAGLNLRAAEKARGVFAIQSAANYAAKGIELLEQGDVHIHHALKLRLYTIGAEMELTLGNGEKAELYGKEILSKDTYSTLEKMPLKIELVRKLAIVDSKFCKAIEEGLKLLDEMGHRLIRSRKMMKIQAIVALKRAVKKANAAPAAKDLHKTLSLSTDKEHKMHILLLAVLSFCAYQAKDTMLHALCACKITHLTLDHGVAPGSSPGFSALGLFVVHIWGDFETGYRIAQKGLAIQKVAGKYRVAATTFTCYVFAIAWREKLSSLIEPLSIGYATGMRVGDITYALWDFIAGRIWISYMIGKPLSYILKELQLIQSQMEELSKSEHLVIVKIFWQMILNMTSNSLNAHKLQGHILDRDEYEEGKPVQLGMVRFAEGELLVFLKPEEAAERAITNVKKFSQLCPSMCLIMIETFHRGVALYIMARKTKLRKYRSHAVKIRKTIQKWQKAANPNVQHYNLLLDAEEAALSKKSFATAEKLYLEAIELASRNGHLHHAALFNERYAHFLQHERKDVEMAAHFWNEASRYYQQWGATKKVKMLMMMNNNSAGPA